MTEDARNGHSPSGGDDEDDEDDAPLDPAEAAAGAAEAAAHTDESLDERVGTIVEELGDVTRTHDGDVELLAVGGRVFAVVGADILEVALGERVAKAALATPDTRPSARGTGWVAFTPPAADRFALDRAGAWVGFAHRRARGGSA